MHKLSVPIMSATVTPANRETYVKQCREAGVERIFLTIGSSIMQPIPEHLAKNVSYFKSCGFEVGVWTDTIGHGFVLTHVENADQSDFTPITDITGRARPHTNCPLDPSFRDYIAAFVAELASTGADIVMLDDDYRMSQHGGELCCACHRHLARIGEIVGERLSVDELRPYVLSGKANQYRDAWLQAQNEGLMDLATAIRTRVDQKYPYVTVCICTAFAPWNVDGTDVSGITRILAGKNKPILRLTGAPYWAVKNFKYPLIGSFEIARMLGSFMSEENFDLMSEGDVYPRPRYTCPAAYLELYDTVTRIDGSYNGILKYMFDYTAGPDFETGYLKAHGENRPFNDKISDFFAEGANAGVRIVVHPHTMKEADLDLSFASEVSPRPLDGVMLGSCGIPTVYKGKGICNSVFGENARAFDFSGLEDGCILDAVSAVILTQRGVDVGLKTYGALEKQNISFVRSRDAERRSFITHGNVRVLSAELLDLAEPMMFYTRNGIECPFAYRYENKDGQRFLVFLFEGDSVYEFPARVCISGLVKNYVTQEVLFDAIPWVARRSLPVCCKGNPELYLMCRRNEDSISVALFNCFADSITDCTVILDEAYDELECVGCEAKIDGRSVTLTSKLYGFTSATFRAYKK